MEDGGVVDFVIIINNNNNKSSSSLLQTPSSSLLQTPDDDYSYSPSSSSSHFPASSQHRSSSSSFFSFLVEVESTFNWYKTLSQRNRKIGESVHERRRIYVYIYIYGIYYPESVHFVIFLRIRKNGFEEEHLLILRLPLAIFVLCV
jgi:hypothetical protein